MNELDKNQPDSTVANLMGHDMNIGGPIKLKKIPITTIENAIANALNELIGDDASTLVSIQELKFNNEFGAGNVSLNLTINKHIPYDDDTVL